jgi:hypothetical protein
MSDEELIEQSGGFWVDDEFRINCRDLVALMEAARRTVSGQEAVTEGELIAISNALQGTGYAYLADKLRNAAPIPATEQKEPK